jgi:hypothetical protein
MGSGPPNPLPAASYTHNPVETMSQRQNGPSRPRLPIPRLRERMTGLVSFVAWGHTVGAAR